MRTFLIILVNFFVLNLNAQLGLNLTQVIDKHGTDYTFDEQNGRFYLSYFKSNLNGESRLETYVFEQKNYDYICTALIFFDKRKNYRFYLNFLDDNFKKIDKNLWINKEETIGSTLSLSEDLVIYTTFLIE
jgi:hypothetical protein